MWSNAISKSYTNSKLWFEPLENVNIWQKVAIENVNTMSMVDICCIDIVWTFSIATILSFVDIF